MCSVDQSIDAFRGEIIGKPPGAAKAADTDWHGMWNRRGGAPGKRQRHVEIATLGEPFAEQAPLCGAAKNEDAWHAKT